MAEHAADTRWVLADRPMHAFQAGLVVPPQLAVISWKRVATGEVGEAQLLDTLAELRPEQVLLERYVWPAVHEQLEQTYHVIYDKSGRTLYLRNDLE